MHIIKIDLENFGAHTAYHETIGVSRFALFEAFNGTGKTTVANAISWVLTGRKIDGSADIANYKPRHDTRLKMVASITLSTGWNGNEANKPSELVLKKEFYEEWKATRENPEPTFTKHVINYFINGTPLKATEYEYELCRMFGVPSYEWLSILTNPKYYPEMLDMSARLKLITDAIGEPMPIEIYAVDKSAGIIGKDLADASFNRDNLRKKLLADVQSKRKTNIGDIAVLADKKIGVAISDEEYIASQNILAEAPTKEANIIASGRGTNPKVAELQEAYNTARANDLSEMRRINDGIDNQIRLKNTETDVAHQVKRNAMADRENAERELSSKRSLLEEKGVAKANKLKTYDAIKASIFVAPEKCDACGRPFAEEDHDDARKRFNAKKAQDLETIIKEGVELKVAIGQLAESIPAIEKKVQLAKSAIVQAEADIRKAESEITQLKTGILYSFQSENAKAIYLQLESERMKPIGSSIDQTAIDAIHAEIKTANAVVQAYIANLKIVQEKTEIEARIKTVQNEIRVLEDKQSALVSYEKTWRDLMESKARQIFPNLRIRFTKQNISGSYERDCTFLNAKNVSYESTNTAEKDDIGIEIIENWKAFYHFVDLPILMDDFEHRDENHQQMNTDAQIVAFKVA